jgi:hypothetical protein
MRERSVADLNEMLRKLGDFQLGLARRESEAREATRKEQDAAFEKRRDELDAEIRSLRAKIDEDKARASEALAKERQEFEKRVAFYDLHEPKAKRRELLERIDKVVQAAEATKLSDPTSKKRTAVHWVCASTALVGLGLTVSMIVKTWTDAANWHYFAFLASGIVIFSSTMIYYIKWNDRWFREHADAEFDAKRFKLDILRASWVAELVQEWGKDGKGELPPDLVSAYTRGLFPDGASSRESDHPLDGLTGIFRRATKVKMGKDGLYLSAEPEKPEKLTGRR